MSDDTQPQNDQILAQYRKRENEFNIIKHRTDTQPFLDDFKTYLTGSKTALVEDDDGSVKTKKFIYGVPKANEAGVQAIMNFVSAAINSHTIQGNFPLDSKAYSASYEQHCMILEKDFATMLEINQTEWEISENEYQSIIDIFMASVKPILSRCIGNEERHSYGETATTVEHHTNAPMKGGILSKL